jgi:hypothetical protein
MGVGGVDVAVGVDVLIGIGVTIDVGVQVGVGVGFVTTGAGDVSV